MIKGFSNTRDKQSCIIIKRIWYMNGIDDLGHVVPGSSIWSGVYPASWIYPALTASLSSSRNEFHSCNSLAYTYSPFIMQRSAKTQNQILTCFKKQSCADRIDPSARTASKYHVAWSSLNSRGANLICIMLIWSHLHKTTWLCSEQMCWLKPFCSRGTI